MTAFDWDDYLSDSKTLRKDQLNEAGENLTIKGLRSQDFDDGKRLFLLFEERAEELGLNKTNMKWLKAHYPGSAESCVGQRINVYVDPLVEYQGKQIGGLKIREETSFSAPVAAEADSMRRLKKLIMLAESKDELVELRREAKDAYVNDRINDEDYQSLMRLIEAEDRF